MPRKATITLNYQNLIAEPPVNPGALFQNAASNDRSTMDHWRHVWIGNTAANKQRFGSFKDHSVAQVFGAQAHKPVVIAGSGPSLKHNAHLLKDRGDLCLVSCLHNFHFFEDLGVNVDYYVSLDAGTIVLDEVSEGGSKTADEYWDLTKNKTLVAYIGSNPELFKKWQGNILLFSAPIPDESIQKSVDEIEVFNVFLSSGGNVLGACLYFAKAILGSNQTVFVGADFSFDLEDNRFHSWDSKYDDNQGQYLLATSIHGVKVKTWPSYWGFKQYFDSVALRVPGLYYNCTEGGLMGAYPEGNITAFKYMDLADYLGQLQMHLQIEKDVKDGTLEPKRLLYS